MANIKIRMKQHTVARLVRPRPDVSAIFESFFSDNDGFAAYIHRSVLDFIEGHAKRHGKNEAIGLLAGRICHDPKTGPYTLVMAVDGARKGEFKSGPGYVELLAIGHDKIRQRLEEAYPDREIVGWYHTHPNYPPSFSSVDEEEQATWSNSNHIGIVYSGLDTPERFGVYRGPSAVQLLRRDEEVRGSELKDSVAQELQPQPHLTPRAKPEVHTQATPFSPPARSKKLKAVLAYAAILLMICLCVGFFRLHYRLASVEAKIRKLSDDKLVKRDSDETPEPPRFSAAELSQTAAASDNLASVDNAIRANGPELHTQAKPFIPETKPHTESPKRPRAIVQNDKFRKISRKKRQPSTNSNKTPVQLRKAKPKELPAPSKEVKSKASQAPPPG